MLQGQNSNEEICIHKNLLNFSTKSRSHRHLSQDLLRFPMLVPCFRNFPGHSTLERWPQRDDLPSPAHSLGFLVHLGRAGCLPSAPCHGGFVLYSNLQWPFPPTHFSLLGKKLCFRQNKSMLPTPPNLSTPPHHLHPSAGVLEGVSHAGGGKLRGPRASTSPQCSWVACLCHSGKSGSHPFHILLSCLGSMSKCLCPLNIHKLKSYSLKMRVLVGRVWGGIQVSKVKASWMGFRPHNRSSREIPSPLHHERTQ